MANATGASPSATAITASSGPPITARAPRLGIERVRLTASTTTTMIIHGGAGIWSVERWPANRIQPRTAAITRQPRAMAAVSPTTVANHTQIGAFVALGGGGWSNCD